MASPIETFEVCPISFYSRKANILIAGIHGVFCGLKFEPDAEIGRKGAFFKVLHFLGAVSVYLTVPRVTSRRFA